MDEQTLQTQIEQWLNTYHNPAEHQTILNNVMTVGKASKRWVDAIQRHVNEVSFSTPERGAVKQACRALLNRNTV